jgi:hypothetical protein
MDETITIADLDIPEGVVVKLPETTPVVQCVMPAEEIEESEAGDNEPEIIGRKKEDDEGGE